MKVEELRIGNWILFPNTTDTGLIIPAIERKVDYIGFGEIISLNPPDIPLNFEARLNNCAPIELTEQWLLKFGFTDGYEGTFTIKAGDSVLVLNSINEGFEEYEYFVKVKYVHQLQNLYFALTGEELIKSFNKQ